MTDHPGIPRVDERKRHAHSHRTHRLERHPRGGLRPGRAHQPGVGTYDVSFPKRAADEAGGTTSPEELIAAAHSACYAMQFSAIIAEKGGTPQALDVSADVSLGPDSAGGFKLTGIKLTVRGEVEGLDEAGFTAAAEEAKASCP